MIRIFITALLYFIGMFTQAQANPNKDHMGPGFSTEIAPYEDCVPLCILQNPKSSEFKVANNEVINKDLTFDSRF